MRGTSTPPPPHPYTPTPVPYFFSFLPAFLFMSLSLWSEGRKGNSGGCTGMPLVSPILISQNLLFASEIMAGGSDGSGAGEGGRSLVARACPAQLRFRPYTVVGYPFFKNIYLTGGLYYSFTFVSIFFN